MEGVALNIYMRYPQAPTDYYLIASEFKINKLLSKQLCFVKPKKDQNFLVQKKRTYSSLFFAKLSGTAHGPIAPSEAKCQ